MNENKMEQVAAMFGKKLGEEFTAKWEPLEYKMMFTRKGLQLLENQEWGFPPGIYRALLTGEAVIDDD